MSVKTDYLQFGVFIQLGRTRQLLVGPVWGFVDVSRCLQVPRGVLERERESWCPQTNKRMAEEKNVNWAPTSASNQWKGDLYLPLI